MPRDCASPPATSSATALHQLEVELPRPIVFDAIADHELRRVFLLKLKPQRRAAMPTPPTTTRCATLRPLREASVRHFTEFVAVAASSKGVNAHADLEPEEDAGYSTEDALKPPIRG
jgi:hypothetical protein